MNWAQIAGWVIIIALGALGLVTAVEWIIDSLLRRKK